MRALFAAAAMIFAANLFLVGYAFAQTTVVDGGSIFGTWRPYLTEIAGILVAAFVGFVLNQVRKRTGLDIEARHREALQTALTNAAGLVIARLDGPAQALKIDVGNPKVAEGVSYVLKSAPDALAYFGIKPETIREKVFAKVGVVASAPVVPNA